MKNPDTKMAAWLKALGTAPIAQERLEKNEQAFLILQHDAPTQYQPILRRTRELATAPADVQANPERWRETIEALRKERLPKAAAALSRSTLPLLARLPFEQALPLLPDAAGVEQWCKVAKANAGTIRSRLLEDPDLALNTTGADWLLAKGKPKEIAPFLARLLQGAIAQRRREAKLLETYLSKDPKGGRLQALLRGAMSDPATINGLADVIRSSKALADRIIDPLGASLRDERLEGGIGAFVRRLFIDLPDAVGERRRAACGRLAKLGSFALAPPANPTAEEALAALQAINEDLRSLTREEATKDQTWLLAPLRDKSEQGTYLTADGARRWGLAWERAQNSVEALDVLETLGFNLGVKPIAKPDTVVEYLPALHEDVVGGMLPGDKGRAITSGWSFEGRSIVRSKVRPDSGTESPP